MEVLSLRSSLGRVIGEGIHESERYEVPFAAIRLALRVGYLLKCKKKEKPNPH